MSTRQIFPKNILYIINKLILKRNKTKYSIIINKKKLDIIKFSNPFNILKRTIIYY